jgi:multidrug efflux pump subunit AcrA (membrane-fusion protein)
MMRPKFKLIKYVLILTSVFIFAFFLLLALGRMDETMEVGGEVSLQNQNLIYSPMDGFVDSVCVKEGQTVKRNQLLILIREENRNSTEVFSPGDGLIFSNSPHKLRGTYVKKDEILMVIADPYQMGFQALVPEGSIPFVQKGLEAALFIDAFPHQRFGTFQGVVTSIASAPESKEGEIFYAVTLLIKKPYVESGIPEDGQRLLLKPGMRGKAKIITRSNVSVLKKLLSRFSS